MTATAPATVSSTTPETWTPEKRRAAIRQHLADLVPVMLAAYSAHEASASKLSGSYAAEASQLGP